MTIHVTGDYRIAADQTVVLKNQWGFELRQAEDGPVPRLINAGEVSVTGRQADQGLIGAVALEGQGARAVIWNRTGASFTVEATGDGGIAEGMELRFADNRVINDGALTVIAARSAIAVIAGLTGSFSNSGLVHVEGGEQAYGVMGDRLDFDNSGRIEVSSDGAAFGVTFDGLGGGEVRNSGEIAVSGTHTVVGVDLPARVFDNHGSIVVDSAGVAIGVHLWGLVETFSNAGLIEAHGVGAVGVEMDFGEAEGGRTLHNAGHIVAEKALEVTPGASALAFVTFHNTGLIEGEILLGAGDDRVLNQGRVIGGVSLGDGDDVYDGRKGQVSERVYGGDGDDTLWGGKHADTLSGGGADTPGGDRVIGGGGADTMSGVGGDNVFVYLKLSDSKVSAPDVIGNLTLKDVIDLSRIDADTTQAGDQAFHLVETLDGHAGEIALSRDDARQLTVLVLDVDGDGQADAEIDLPGQHTGFTNFIL